jgi:hypothetical protein
MAGTLAAAPILIASATPGADHRKDGAAMARAVVAEISAEQALAWRLHRHGLAERSPTWDPAAVAGRLCGLHAQVMASAELSVVARRDGLPRTAVADALWRDRTLVKLWAARGTLHLLPAAELGMWLGALGTLRKFGNDGNRDTERICRAVGAALADRVLSRDDLAAEVGRSTGSARLADWVRSSWGSDLKAASFRGLLCFAEPQGRVARFAAPARWVPRLGPTGSPEESLRAVARRFLQAYAPATAESIARWWVGPPSLPVGRSLLATLGDEAVPVTFAGRTAVVLAADLDEMRRAGGASSYRLLPAFDPWVIGMPRGEPFVRPDHLPEVFRPAGRIAPVVLAGGRVAGRWTHRSDGRGVDLAIVPFGPIPRAGRAALAGEAERVAGHLGRALRLRWAD